MSFLSVDPKISGNTPDGEQTAAPNNSGNGDEMLGLRVREIRNQRGWSLRQMAKISSLNINTLSLIEKGKTSPSIYTLQRLAAAMDVPIKEFFEPVENALPVVFTSHEQRPQSASEKAIISNLGKGLSSINRWRSLSFFDQAERVDVQAANFGP